MSECILLLRSEPVRIWTPLNTFDTFGVGPISYPHPTWLIFRSITAPSTGFSQKVKVQNEKEMNWENGSFSHVFSRKYIWIVCTLKLDGYGILTAISGGVYYEISSVCLCNQRNLGSDDLTYIGDSVPPGGKPWEQVCMQS